MTVPRLFVTGGSGFIGTHFINAALAQGAEVCNFDLKAPVLPEHRPHWHQGDLLDAALVGQLVRDFRPDAILNLAALADISLSWSQMPANIAGVRSLIKAARAVEPRPRVVHVSSQLVVGPGHSYEGPRIYQPYTEYGKSKAASEEVLWEEADDLEWTILRPTNIWGPWHATFVPSTWKYINRRWYMTPTGYDPVRSFGYVRNVADQMLRACTMPMAAIDHGIFYVGDEPIPSREWLDGFSLALTGRPLRRVPISMLRLLARGGDLAKRIGGPAPLDSGRLFRLITDYGVPMAPSFAVFGPPPVSLGEGIDETVAWLRTEHPVEFRSR